MGVDRLDYLMFGVDVGYDAFDWDKHESLIEGDGEFDVIHDGMSGNYCIAGKVIAQSDPYEGFDKSVIDPSNLEIDRDDLAEKVSGAFGATVDPGDFRLILFTHFF